MATTCVIVFATLLTILPNVGSWIILLAIRKRARVLFTQIKLPTWAFPGWTEFPAWTLIYCGIGYASFLVYREGNGFHGAAQIPLILYGIQLIFNWGFLPLFFARHKLKCSYYHLLLTNIEAVFCAAAFYTVEPMAGTLFIPYILWHIYMTCLTYAIYRDHPEIGMKRFRNEEFFTPELIIGKEIQ